ncbi:hypothetical protein [Mucilaginibacter sp.]|uniref:hypothetical protein n=1 Tax=Mucilaginibacter sp. TaxID=1882438 RepID=UPI0035BC35A7
MSLKSISQTRWKLEPQSVSIYPYGLSYILGVILAVGFGVIMFLYVKYQNTTISESLPLVLGLVLTVILFWGFAGTAIVFDNRTGSMRKLLMGFIPVNTIPFAKLQGISPVSNLYGSYKYRLFRKDNKFGKGILVSCAYTKNDDPNAVAFIDEAVTTIHGYLNAYDTPADYVAAPITDYKYFAEQGGKYILKKNKVGSTILGLALFAIGIHELTPVAWLGHDLAIGRICMLIFAIVGGPAIVLAGFTNITLDTLGRTLERKSPIGLGNKIYSFDDYNGVQTVRKSMNFIYTGTEVRLYFLKPDGEKQDVIVLQSFYKTSNVERFIQEVQSILKSSIRR